MAFFIYYRCMQVVVSALYVCIYWAAEHQTVCSAAFIIPSSRLAKTTASTNAEVSAIGPAYMTPSIPKRKGRHRLDSVGKSHQHEDSEIFFRKLKVQVASVSEDAYDLVREELETDKKYGCNHST